MHCWSLPFTTPRGYPKSCLSEAALSYFCLCQLLLFYLPIFEKLVPESRRRQSRHAVFFFLPGKVSKQLWGVYHAPSPKGLVLMGKNLTTLLKADNIVCWIFRAIWATECFFHSLWNTYPSINDPGFNLKIPWVILSRLQHISLLIWSAVWPLEVNDIYLLNML